ncbi:hypothetical protein T12_4999, partial [Trichinella patagoniensis]
LTEKERHRHVICVGNAYVALIEKERHRHQLSSSLISTIDESRRYRYCINKADIFAYSLLQKNAPLTTLWPNSNTARSFRGPTALKASEKLSAEGRLKNQKYGHLGMLCGTRTLGLIYSDVVKKGILEEWPKTLYGDLIPLPRNIFKQMSRTNIRNKNTSTDGVNTFMQNVIQYFY